MAGLRSARVSILGMMLLGCSSTTSAPVDDAGPTEDARTTPGSCGHDARATEIPDTCNGSAALCDRTFDRVTFPMTHNAMSNGDERYAAPNQHHAVARQLEDGVRGLMLDTHYYDADSDKTLEEPLPGVAAVDQVYLCHGVCQLGRRRLLDTLCEIRSFLDRHRGEVLSIIFESYVKEEDMVAVISAASLDDYVFTYHGEAFPTLREMIAKDQRLFLFVENGGGTPAWYHPAWSIIRDTPYSFAKPSDFSCAPNRGKRENPLFLLNHWVGDPLPDPARAKEVNARDLLLGRAQQCAMEQGATPNFVGVDFYDVGDLFAVVKELNGL